MAQVKIDGQEYEAGDKELTGEQILALVDKSYPDWELVLVLDGKSVKIAKNQPVELDAASKGQFVTQPAKPTRPDQPTKPDQPDKDGQLLVKIDGTEYPAPQPVMTGEAIMGLVGRDYNGWSLNKKLQSGRRVKVAKDEEVDLRDPDLERFETIPLQAQQGQPPLWH